MKGKIRVNIADVTKDYFITVHIDGTWRVWIASKLINIACWVLGANYEEE